LVPTKEVVLNTLVILTHNHKHVTDINMTTGISDRLVWSACFFSL